MEVIIGYSGEFFGSVFSLVILLKCVCFDYVRMCWNWVICFGEEKCGLLCVCCRW